MKLLLFFLIIFSALASEVPVANFLATEQTFFENEQYGQFIIRLSRATDKAVKIPFSVSGNSTYGEDHNLKNGTIYIPANHATSILRFSIYKDNIEENIEEVAVTMMAPSNAVLGDKRKSVIKIFDKPLILPILSFDRAVIHTESGNKVELSILIDRPANFKILVPLKISGTAKFPLDHNLKLDKLIFHPGETAAKIKFKIAKKNFESGKFISLEFGTPTTNVSMGKIIYTKVIIAPTSSSKQQDSSNGSDDEIYPMFSGIVFKGRDVSRYFRAFIKGSLRATHAPVLLKDYDINQGQISSEIIP